MLRSTACLLALLVCFSQGCVGGGGAPDTGDPDGGSAGGSGGGTAGGSGGGTAGGSAGGTGGSAGGGSAGGAGGGTAGGSGGGIAGGSGGGSAGGSGGGSAGGSGGGSAGGSGGGAAGGSGGGSAGGSGGGAAGGSGGGSAGGSGGGSGQAGLTNGDFESGLTGWSSVGTTSVSNTAFSGTQSAQVGSATATGLSSVSQTFTVSAAATLSFSYQGVCNDTVMYAYATATLADNTAGTSATLLANTCTKTGAWVRVTSAPIPAGHSVTLTLSNTGEVYMSNYGYTLYDDVTLTSSGSGGGSGGGTAGGSGGGAAGGAGGGSAGGSGGGSAGGSGGGSAGGSGGGSGGGSTDGTPVRTAQCTPYSTFTGTAVNTAHGRLDGTISYVVPLNGSSSCNGDSGHIHIQVTVNGSLYDVAVDVGTSNGDALLYEADMAMPDGAWSEGWHNDALSYTSLGIKSTMFTSEDPSTFATYLEQELSTVNHISVFGTGYTPLPSNGVHDIHYENGSDGALVLEPLSATPHLLFFRFSTDSF